MQKSYAIIIIIICIVVKELPYFFIVTKTY